MELPQIIQKKDNVLVLKAMVGIPYWNPVKNCHEMAAYNPNIIQ
jgi:hypothetical protein